jgi:antitoxin (DNA-binding transcriptional repressor) of toxin-antitoxin stability system
MTTQQRISLEKAQSTLADLVHRLRAGDEVVIVEGQRTVARLLGPSPRKGQPRKPGSAKGKLSILVEDDEHLRDFEDYMP